VARDPFDDPETWRAFQTPAASATAGYRPAEVSARTESAAPSAGHLTSAGPPAAEDDPAGPSPLPAGSPNFVGLLHVDDLVAVAAEHIGAHGRHEHYSDDGEKLWRCDRLCGLENLTAGEHARHVAELSALAIVYELTTAATSRAVSECAAANERVAERLTDAGFNHRLSSNAAVAAQFFPQHTK
jgi:hypothetical protein